MAWLAERFQKVLDKERVSLRQLEKEIGIGSGYLSMIRTSRREHIGRKVAGKLSVRFDKPIEYFLYEQFDDKEVLTPRRYRSIIGEVPVEVLAYIPVYAIIPNKKGVMPVDYIAVTQQPAPESLVGLRIPGLTMEPGICEGDTLIVNKALTPNSKDIVVRVINGVAKLEYYRANKDSIFGVVEGIYKRLRQ